MKASDSTGSKFGDDYSPEHDALVFEAEAYFRKLFKVIKVSYEVPVLAGNGFVVGYIDLLIEVVDSKYGHVSKCVVEVKPIINSFGALLRQLNTYKSHIERRRVDISHKHEVFIFCVYTHDQQYATQIESQGYVCYPKTTKKKSKTK